jgi:virulence-associated protein VagC
LSVVTTAVRLPESFGLVENVTVSEVAVAAVIVPMAPSLKMTSLLAAVGSKPKPLMVIWVASAVFRVPISIAT